MLKIIQAFWIEKKRINKINTLIRKLDETAILTLQVDHFKFLHIPDHR